jgi:pimeloyl-ACP methyl ester carboxylesterase
VPRIEELHVRAGEVTLAGTLTLPDEPPPPDRRGRYPNALLLPSWLPRTRDGVFDAIRHPRWFAAGAMPPGLLRRLADALAARGVASLRCDPRGCGASEGSWAESALFTRIDDARDMLAAMRSHGTLDLRRTGIVGHGEGATLALSAAIGDPAVSALTLVGAAARSQRDVLRRGVGERSRTGVDRQHPLVAAIDRASEELIERAERREPSMDLHVDATTLVRLELAALEQAIHTPNLALVTMLHRSVTLVHGELDAWAAPDESELLLFALREAGNEPRRLPVPGAGHELAEADDALVGQLADDLVARLLPRDLPPVLVALEEMGGGIQ